MPRYYIPYREGVPCADGLYSGGIEARLGKVFERVRTARQFGWRNQPRVFTFSSPLDLDGVNARLKETGLPDAYTWFPSAMIKDW